MSDRIAFIAVLVLIGGVMYYRHGLALPDNLLAQWVVIGIAVYVVGRGWWWLCRHHPFVAIGVLGFLRGLLGGGRGRW